jgi:hypothetical protein
VYLYPAIVAVLSLRFGHRLSGRRAWLALGISLCGVVLAVGGIDPDESPPVSGLLLAFASCFIYAVWVILAARLSGERREAVAADAEGGGSATVTVALIMTATATVYWVSALATKQPVLPGQVPTDAWPGLIGVGGGGNLTGISIGGIGVGAAGEVKGLSIGGIGVGSGKSVTGLSIAGIGVGSPSLNGLVISVIGAGAQDVHAIVIAGAFFKVEPRGRFDGGSLSLVNNIRGEQHGLTIGLFNYARELHGAQIGLINISDNSGSRRVLPLISVR